MHLISLWLLPACDKYIDDFPSWNCPQCHGSGTLMEYSPLDIRRLLESSSLIAQLIFASMVSENIRWACDWRSTPVVSNWPFAERFFGSAKNKPCK